MHVLILKVLKSCLFQSRLKEAANAAIKDQEVSDLQSAVAAGEFFESSDVRSVDASVENSDNNESSLLI